MKDYRAFDPSPLNQNLRGCVFLFIDNLLSKPKKQLDFEGVKKIFKFLDFFLGFSVFYLRNYPNLIGHVNILSKDF